MTNERIAQMRDDIKNRDLSDVERKTKNTLLAINSILNMQQLAQLSPRGHYDTLDATLERMQEYANEYAYLLGYKNVLESPSATPVDITEIEAEISASDNICDFTPFINARDEYTLGQYAAEEEKEG